MCFIIHEKHKEIKVAKRGITCYKAGHRKGEIFKSSVQLFCYDVGQEETARMKMENRVVRQGFHSFSELVEAELWANFWCEHVAVFRIPKSAKYYFNPERKEYVSNKIKFIKFL